MHELVAEYEKLREAGFVLQFRYPTAKEREHLRTIHRDMTKAEKQRIDDQNRSLRKLIADITEGNIDIDDLDEDALRALDKLRARRRKA